MTRTPPDDTDKEPSSRFSNLTFEEFRKRANNSQLSKFEKIGFPDTFRQNHEQDIFSDILKKLENLSHEGADILDIGPGCSDLPRLLIAHCTSRNQNLVLMDSAEMLDLLPDDRAVTKVSGRFPEQKSKLPERLTTGGCDAVLVYSVLQHVFIDANPFTFLDNLLSLLKPGGELLIGDIPNASKLRRFLSSDTGAAYHKVYMKTDDPPVIAAHNIDDEKISDAVILGLVSRARAAGFDAFMLPQPAGLPMSNRREDLYIRRP